MSDISDAGGVAARIGFKYQDHVAASFVLEMIGDRRILQIECETSDDIARIISLSGSLVPEYVQVKTTDKDTKWTITEVASRSNKNTASSLVEKSLLADSTVLTLEFRIVTRRSVNASLLALIDPVDKRDAAGDIAILAAKLKKKHPKTISAEGHDLEYWARNAVWDARFGLDLVETQNLQLISRLAEEFGTNPSHSEARRIYRDLLRIVDGAASASRRDQSQKIITREAASNWWNDQLSTVQATAAATKEAL